MRLHTRWLSFAFVAGLSVMISTVAGYDALAEETRYEFSTDTFQLGR